MIRTGIASIDDHLLGLGGFERGHLFEILGREAAGKTTLALQTIASVQKTGDVCAFIDGAHELDPKYAATLGVELRDLLVSQPDSGEQALEIIETLVRSSAVGLIVVDRFDALWSKPSTDEVEDGLHARHVATAMRKLCAAALKTRATVLFINRTTPPTGLFTAPTTSVGSNALKFYATARLEMRRVTASSVWIKTVKNKQTAPFRDARLALVGAAGLSEMPAAVAATTGVEG